MPNITGIRTIEVSDKDMDVFYRNPTINQFGALPNTYVVLRTSLDEAIGPYLWDGVKYEEVKYHKFESKMFGSIKPMPKDPYQVAYFDSIARNQMTICTGTAGSGKAIPNSTLIPTPSGMRSVKDIKLGDFLFDANGNPTQVTGVFPQGKKKVNKIIFSDGREAKCCDEHLWYHSNAHKTKYHTSSVKELKKKILWSNSHKSWNYRIPVSKALILSHKEFSVDPYLIGCLIGDGCLKQSSLTISSKDIELIEECSRLLGSPKYYNDGNNYNWIFYLPENDRKKHSIQVRFLTKQVLANYPQLINSDSYSKRIPEEYFWGDIDQRKSLLQGLLDTDGSIDPEKGRISYTSVNLELIKDVIRLCRSLGFVVSNIHKDLRDKYKAGICYDINISLAPEEKRDLFRLSRKKQIAENFSGKGQEYRYKYISITDIQELSEEEEMTCFTVDNDQHLFLMNDFIVTHNSMIAMAYAFQELERGRISKIIIFCNPYVARDAMKFGFLPGTKQDKLLETSVGSILISKIGSRATVEEMIEKEEIILMPIGDCRGYEVPKDAFVYFSESQNSSRYLMRLFLERTNDECKIVVEGDSLQYDADVFANGYNGLVRAIEVFVGEDYAGHVQLQHNYRGRISRKAAEITD